MPQSFSRKLIVILIFGVLPVVAIFLFANHLLEFTEKNHLFAAQNKLKQKLISVAEKASPEGFYFQLFENLFARLRREKDTGDSGKTQAIIGSFANLYQTEFLAYVFDDRGEVKQLSGLSLPNRFIIGKIWDILAETQNYKPGEDEKKQLKRMQLLLGAESDGGRLKNMEGHLISLKKKRVDGFFFWKRFSAESKAGVIFLAMPVENTESVLRKHAVDAQRDGFKLSYWHHESPTPLFSQIDESAALLARNNLELGNDGFAAFDFRLWSILKTRMGVFVASLPLFAYQLQNVRGMLNLCFAAVLLLMLVVLFDPRINLQTTYIRIGNKLSAILLAVVAIPVAALALTGILAIADHEKVLLLRIEKDQQQRLSALEDEFIREEKNFARICSKLRHQVVEKFSLDAFNQESQELLRDRQAVRIELRGLNGDLMSMCNYGGYFEGLEKTNDGFSRYLIRQHLSKRSSDENVLLKHAPDEVFSDIFDSSDFGFAQISAAPNRVHAFRFGQNELFWYWSYIAEPGHPAAILTIFQAVNIARENFLHRVLKSSLASSEKMGAYDCNRRVWLNGGFAGSKDANELVRAAQISGRPESRLVSLPHGRFVALAFPGTLLAPFSLLSLISDEDIVGQQNQLSLALICGIALILFVAMAIAHLLARTFLEPVKELDRGMRQIQARGPEARVVIDSGDEFGELGKAFNQMVDDLKEMQLAKIVQESLFPQERPQIQGFDTAIFNLTATDLGGDYCDAIKISEHQWLLLIGDVSGHGTPAALAMAMVKAAIFKACRDGLQFHLLAGSLSELLLKTLSRKKMMTMLFVLLDNSHNSVRFINAGHNWPIILRQNGTVEEIRVTGLPLGVRETRRLREEVVANIEPGDALFCYTDALVECRSPDDEVFGHQRLYGELKRACGMGSQELIAHLENCWHKYLAGGVREDDLTMLVVKKCEPEVQL